MAQLGLTQDLKCKYMYKDVEHLRQDSHVVGKLLLILNDLKQNPIKGNSHIALLIYSHNI